MSTKHTPGSWHVIKAANLDRSGKHVADLGEFIVVTAIGVRLGDPEADARLIAAAPDLLAEIEREYAALADITNQWPGRSTMEGQGKLVRLRDLIAMATGRGAEEVQDDFCMRATIAKKEAQS